MSRFNHVLKTRALLLGLILVILMLGLTGCKTGKQTALPTPDPMYEDPLDDPVYEKAVMENGPEFTEAELLKAMADVEPATHNGMKEVLDHMTQKAGWDRNRAYYVLSKTAVAEFLLSDPSSREMIKAEYPQGMPTDKELDLVSKNRAAVHKGMDMED